VINRGNNRRDVLRTPAGFQALLAAKAKADLNGDGNHRTVARFRTLASTGRSMPLTVSLW
jgi:hypothetical protein